MIENKNPYDSATGKKLVMREFLPGSEVGSEVRPRAGMVLIHGVGDYVSRYRQVVESLAALGVAVVGVDLPGHGESDGKRGRVGRLRDVHTVIDEARGVLRGIVEPVGGQVGALAHSGGGLMLFDYLTRYPGNFSFAWVNSCLVDPLHRRGASAAPLARVANLVAPSLTISTRVVPSMGKDGDPGEHPPPGEGKGHDRISVRFGLELVRARDRVAEYHANLDRDFRLLMTHGARDEVCPIGFAREFYSMLDLRRKEFREFPQHLHHLLHDPAVMAFGTDWLRRVLTPPRIFKLA